VQLQDKGEKVAILHKTSTPRNHFSLISIYAIQNKPHTHPAVTEPMPCAHKNSGPSARRRKDFPPYGTMVLLIVPKGPLSPTVFTQRRQK
jgi:hypothetical protein